MTAYCWVTHTLHSHRMCETGLRASSCMNAYLHSTIQRPGDLHWIWEHSLKMKMTNGKPYGPHQVPYFGQFSIIKTECKCCSAIKIKKSLSSESDLKIVMQFYFWLSNYYCMSVSVNIRSHYLPEKKKKSKHCRGTTACQWGSNFKGTSYLYLIYIYTDCEMVCR